MRDDKCKLFVGNLSFNVSSEELERIFAEVEGVEVKEAAVVMDRDSGRPRGFGFVQLADEAMLQIAIDALNNKEIDGRNIAVKVAEPRENRGGGNRGGYQQNNNYRSGGRRY
jgi:RNA recognition motif-containing protein